MKARHIPRRTHRDRILAVEGGEVMCPRQGIVDVEQCWICPAYDGLSGGRSEGVVCTAVLLVSANHLRPLFG